MRDSLILIKLAKRKKKLTLIYKVDQDVKKHTPSYTTCGKRHLYSFSEAKLDCWCPLAQVHYLEAFLQKYTHVLNDMCIPFIRAKEKICQVKPDQKEKNLLNYADWYHRPLCHVYQYDKLCGLGTSLGPSKREKKQTTEQY